MEEITGKKYLESCQINIGTLLESHKGSYVLILYLKHAKMIQVGKLGRFFFIGVTMLMWGARLVRVA